MATEDRTPSHYMVEDEDSVGMDLAERINQFNWDPDSAGAVMALFPVDWTLGYRPSAPLTLQAAAALHAALHTPDELTEMGMRTARHLTRTNAATQHRASVVLELTGATEDDCPFLR
ncbi:hypothetical protein SCYAM73S_00441 [Streptomyces cyaneofuscatus]|uniref:hypothetical protein n=1 Tax=Streptomyces cyaneofuscatus TaxID=66883 RepID=UPI0006909D16|nr:hypothetical protein [Streptomyces cyaneofuscatus]